MDPGVRYALVSGHTEAFLGYIFPKYNLPLDPVTPCLHEPAADRHEETSSIVRWRPQP